MPSDVFQCKQFTIRQDQTAMKVGTDGMLLGAWTTVNEGDRVLDIGTGTGLLALMMAQKEVGHVDAVELEQSAAAQAHENSANSPWAERIMVHHQGVQDFAKASSEKYDLIICNPPYFTQGISSRTTQRDQARSNKFLPVADLIQVLSRLLKPSGRASLIMPIGLQPLLEQQAAIFDFFVHRHLTVQPAPNKPPHRVLLELKNGFPLNIHREELTIRDKQGQYTSAYRDQTKDFYLSYS